MVGIYTVALDYVVVKIIPDAIFRMADILMSVKLKHIMFVIATHNAIRHRV